jgi:hypothetical integral membrane protein (TIGR02206 family)
VRLFGSVHLALIAAIAAAAAALAILCRRGLIAPRPLRLALGWGLAANEIAWFIFRYSHEGVRWTNLPLQLCDAALWVTVAACLTLAPRAVEFAYFAGLAGSGMAILTPDLWSPWPSYPAIYFFVAHGGIVIAVSALVFGRISPLASGALRRAFTMVVVFAAFDGVFDAVFHTNYMYLRHKPVKVSLLNAFGPWPIYLVPAALVALAIFWLLWLPVRPSPAWYNGRSR